MQARVRTDDGEYSYWFEVTQGLRQGCVLSPLLFNIFFAAAIEVVLVRLSEDDSILKDLVYLEEDAGVGAGTRLERVRRAVWGMLYADDAGVVSRCQEGLTRMMTIIVEVFGALGLTVSEKKTETLLMRAPEKQPNKRGIAATTAGHRSSGAKARSDRPVPILGWSCQRRWRAHAGDQLPEQSSVGMHQEVLPGALRPTENTVETSGSTV